jgi:hypothetical protein
MRMPRDSDVSWILGGNAIPRTLDQFRIARVYDKLDDTDCARHWYERFTEDWKDADPDIPELIEARERLGEMKGAQMETGS